MSAVCAIALLLLHCSHSLRHTRVHLRLRLRTMHLHASDNNRTSAASPTNSLKTSSSLENIGLFAASDKKAPLPASSLVKTMTPSTPIPSTAAAGSAVSVEAETLRLEAEREQLSIDRERIAREKEVLLATDRFVLQLLEVPVPSDGNDTVYDSLVNSNKQLLRRDLFFRLIELSNLAKDASEKSKFITLNDNVMNVIQRLDSSLYASLVADIEKEIASELDRLKTGQRNKDAENVKVYDQVLRQWIAQTNANASIGALGANGTSLMDAASMPGRALIRFPSAMPLILLPFMLRSTELTATDLEVCKSQIFTSDILNNTIVDYATFLITFRGQPYTSIANTLKAIQRRIDDLGDGLADRVKVIVLPEYKVVNPDNSFTEKYAADTFEPVFIVINKEAKPRKVETPEIAFAAVAAIAGFATTFIYATDVNSLNADFIKIALAGDNTAVERVFTVLLGVLGIQALHDMAHYSSAALNKVKLGIPILLPSLQIGIFGTVLRFLEYPKTRKELFDVSIAGPLVGLVASLACSLYGLDLTAHADPAALSTFPALPVGFFRSSFLLDELVKAYLHPADASPTGLVAMHPLFVIGLAGLLSNAYNFLPIGKTDGGRVTMAIAGRQSASSISNIFLLGLGVSLITSTASPVALFWGLYVSLFLRSPDLPPEDDVTPIARQEDDASKGPMWFARIVALLVCVSISALTILPVPIDQATVTEAGNSINSILQTMPGAPPLSI